MKRIVPLLLLASLQAHAQCDEPFVHSTGITYTISTRSLAGIGIEKALLTGIFPLSVHIGTTLRFDYEVQKDNKESPTIRKFLDPEIYSALEVRVFRSDYVVTVSVGAMLQMDFNGFGVAATSVILFPMGNKAISVRPFYSLGRNRYAGLQLGLNFRNDR